MSELLNIRVDLYHTADVGYTIRAARITCQECGWHWSWQEPEEKPPHLRIRLTAMARDHVCGEVDDA